MTGGTRMRPIIVGAVSGHTTQPGADRPAEQPRLWLPKFQFTKFGGMKPTQPPNYKHDQQQLQHPRPPDPDMLKVQPQGGDALIVLLPLLIVLSTLLLLLLLFLVCFVLLRKRRGIVLRDTDGPIDLSRDELIDGDGGFEGVESRWLETVSEDDRRNYHRAKQYQLHYPPNSLPTDITLSQFLSIQEKGVSAWSFEPDYEYSVSLLVHSRTEITFLPDPSTSSSVQSNLPLPKLNEVYYWEVKMFDLPPTTTVSVGLATKPYPSFRLPGLNRYSVAYHSNGDKSYNYPMTATQLGPVLKEGDVLGVGYRPRTGTVFFTRNGRKLEDAFTGLTRWNLFPTVGADGPCSVHVNLGQSGFVFIEANVKKWGLAPSVGTLAPPPAYGSERGSILLEAGGGRRAEQTTPPSTSHSPPRRQHRLRRPKPNNAPVTPSPLGVNSPLSPPPPFVSPTVEEPAAGPSTQAAEPPRTSRSTPSSSSSRSSQRTTRIVRPQTNIPTLQINSSSPQPDSPDVMNPPTPNVSDIHLNEMPSSPVSSAQPSPETEDEPVTLVEALADASGTSSVPGRPATQDTIRTREPPEYSPLDAYRYAEGVHIDLPAEVIAAALEGAPYTPPEPPTSPGGRTRRR